jgi:hypothetical protein
MMIFLWKIVLKNRSVFTENYSEIRFDGKALLDMIVEYLIDKKYFKSKSWRAGRRGVG